MSTKKFVEPFGSGSFYRLATGWRERVIVAEPLAGRLRVRWPGVVVGVMPPPVEPREVFSIWTVLSKTYHSGQLLRRAQFQGSFMIVR